MSLLMGLHRSHGQEGHQVMFWFMHPSSGSGRDASIEFIPCSVQLETPPENLEDGENPFFSEGICFVM